MCSTLRSGASVTAVGPVATGSASGAVKPAGTVVGSSRIVEAGSYGARAKTKLPAASVVAPSPLGSSTTRIPCNEASAGTLPGSPPKRTVPAIERCGNSVTSSFGAATGAVPAVTSSVGEP